MDTDDPDLSTTDLHPLLRDVYWIGGGPGGGKSTIARRIAEAHCLHCT